MDNLDSSNESLDIVFGIDLISENIFRRLDIKDLLRMRRVSTQFAVPTTNWIIRQNLGPPMNFSFVSNICNDIEKLETFNKILKRRLEFSQNYLPSPINKFRFSGIFNEPSIQEFFQYHGSSITSLQLHFPSLTFDEKGQLQRQNILRILKLVPNIQDLTLISVDFECPQELNINFNKLKQFTCSGSLWSSASIDPTQPSLALKILNNSPNLTTVNNVKLQDLPFFTQIGKSGLIKDLTIVIHPNMFTNQQSCPNKRMEALQVLAIEFFCRGDEMDSFVVFEIFQEMFKILNENPQTKQLQIRPMGQLNFVSNLELAQVVEPIQNGITHLKSTDKLDLLPSRLFPRGLNLNKYLPNLKSVELKLMARNADPMVNHCFPIEGVPIEEKFGTVTYLYIDLSGYGEKTGSIFDRIHNWFYNLVHFKVTGTLLFWSLREIFQVWGAGSSRDGGFGQRNHKLQVLEYYDYSRVDHRPDYPDDDFPLEDILIGNATTACELRRKYKIMENDLDDHRFHLNIFHLEALKRFKILSSGKKFEAEMSPKIFFHKFA